MSVRQLNADPALVPSVEIAAENIIVEHPEKELPETGLDINEGEPAKEQEKGDLPDESGFECLGIQRLVLYFLTQSQPLFPLPFEAVVAPVNFYQIADGDVDALIIGNELAVGAFETVEHKPQEPWHTGHDEYGGDELPEHGQGASPPNPGKQKDPNGDQGDFKGGGDRPDPIQRLFQSQSESRNQNEGEHRTKA